MIAVADTNCPCQIKAAVNFNERLVEKPDLLIIHYTGMPSGDQALDWLCIEQSQVSCHYLVHEDGRIVQMVRESLRAWHAGQSSWAGQTDINSRSIGIEIVNPGAEHGYNDFPEAQISSVIDLCDDIVSRNGITPRNVLAHSDIAPLRKQDPGEKFPWSSLFDAGIGHWVSASELTDGRFFQLGDQGSPIEALQTMLKLYGYGIEINGQFDELTKAVIIAFQRHFRQSKVDGIADASTINTLYRLINSLSKV